VVDECSQTLTFSNDGNFSPLVCGNGQSLNALAWKAAAPDSPQVMGLGPSATAPQVSAALCADLTRSTIPIEQSAYALAAMYYGWNLGFTPHSIFTTLTSC
jgi:hypothetical protein